MTLAELAGVIVGLVALTGVYVWGLGGKSKTETNEAIMQENTSLRNQLGDSKATVATLTAQLEAAEKNEQIFKEIALGKPDFEKLSIQLTRQHKEIIQSLTALTKAITETRKA